MTDPEKMVWAAAFAAAAMNDADPNDCAYQAWFAVDTLRKAQPADEIVEWRKMLREFRDGPSIPATIREFKNAKDAAEIEVLVAEAIKELHDKYSHPDMDIETGREKADAIESLEVRIERKLGRPLRGG